jgi:hypothetical protein
MQFYKKQEKVWMRILARKDSEKGYYVRTEPYCMCSS